jgi:hypothetical protein
MSTHSPLIRYQAAQLRVDRAAEQCPHWYYESASEEPHDCCAELYDSLIERNKARRVWRKTEGQS